MFFTAETVSLFLFIALSLITLSFEGSKSYVSFLLVNPFLFFKYTEGMYYLIEIDNNILSLFISNGWAPAHIEFTREDSR
jgi:flagellar assembly factor FliW